MSAFCPCAPLPWPAPRAAPPLSPRPHHAPMCVAEPASPPLPLLLRAISSQPTARPPVWLLRQAGRYMSAFREYSDRYPFRHRSETPEIACELSLQPYRAFRPDAVIMFSDILTPLPALGVSFDIVKGKGPVIHGAWTTPQDLANIEELDLDKVPFVKELLGKLRAELKSDPETALLGFVGAPFTLASYIIEGGSVKHLTNVKRLFPSAALNRFLAHLAHAIADYSVFQIDAGAQAIVIFDSWAHHVSPRQYEYLSMPYAETLIRKIKKARPEVPVIFFANGTAGKLHVIKRLVGVADVIGIDWHTCMKEARHVLGEDVVLMGNVDPTVLAVGSEQLIREEVRRCVRDGQRKTGGGGLIVNVGHGIIQGTPEDSVRVFVEEVKKIAA